MSIRSIIGSIALLFFVAQPSHAAVDYFLVIDGIPGESTDARYPNAIKIEGFSFGVTGYVPLIGGGGGAGKPVFSDISFTKIIDKSSPLLFLQCAQGKHIPSATLYCRKAGERPTEFYVIKMTDVLISSFQTSGSSDALPTETLSLNYTKIELSYTPQKPDGSPGTPVETGWDIETNTQFPR
jgi:type VI secretion system secreted protein Hcp